ncbi:arsenate reductase ArsC [Syntrophothermus lipocalidus]|uniref:Protein-tyrosine phosphatase, low molecular weight n=1 Tax=Syntrophothermus lipocalidus (strain DSM 12680 / TGB-C1) TaxID=643648 RepID=D7CLJ3_SYNLT|nr:arsenate reductase ArsC [Syntrophothermus lipocalidus]ADI01578.1 Protein-tyrosine phosphatase, low molecular weight [Syntrophothermus lipocalidus DSM 12680]
MRSKPKVLFLCTQNSARSQMAEALMRHMYGDRFDVFSAGTNPGVVNPYAIRAMQELGVDMSSHRSKSVDEFMGQDFDYVVTVCDNARKNCPFFPGKNVIHRAFRDPAAAKGTKEEVMAVFRQIRDEIQSWLKEQFGQ